MTVPADFDPAAILMTSTEVAASLRISERHLKNLVEAGRVPAPAVAHHRYKRWTRAQLELWAASLKAAPAVA